MSSIAQAKSYRGFVEGGFGAFVGSTTGSVLSLSTSHGKMFGAVFVGFFTRKLFISLETNNAK